MVSTEAGKSPKTGDSAEPHLLSVAGEFGEVKLK